MSKAAVHKQGPSRAHLAASVQVCVRSSKLRGSGGKSAGLAAGGGHVAQLPPSQHEPGGRVQCRPPGAQQGAEVGAPLTGLTAQSRPVPSGPGSTQCAPPPGKDHVAAAQAENTLQHGARIHRVLVRSFVRSFFH